MSAATTCPACGKPATYGELICPHPDCGAFIDWHSLATLTTPDSSPAESVVSPTPHHPSAPLRCSVEWCPATLQSGDEQCSLGHRAPARAPELVSSDHAWGLALPDGSHLPLIPGVALILGRHSPDPQIAASLGGFDVVSRRHAEVLARPDGVHIRDLGSSNHTYVDGQEVLSVVVQAPCTIRLGQHIIVSLTETGG